MMAKWREKEITRREGREQICEDLDHEELKLLVHLPIQIETQTKNESISRKLWLLNHGKRIKKRKEKEKNKARSVRVTQPDDQQSGLSDCRAMINLDRSGLKNKTGATASRKYPALRTTEQQRPLSMTKSQIEPGQTQTHNFI